MTVTIEQVRDDERTYLKQNRIERHSQLDDKNKRAYTLQTVNMVHFLYEQAHRVNQFKVERLSSPSLDIFFESRDEDGEDKINTRKRRRNTPTKTITWINNDKQNRQNKSTLRHPRSVHVTRTSFVFPQRKTNVYI